MCKEFIYVAKESAKCKNPKDWKTEGNPTQLGPALKILNINKIL